MGAESNGKLNIVSPCHGAKLLVLTTSQSTGYSGFEDVVSEIVCTADKCYNSWEPDGAAGAYNK